ncbi:Uncharacterised protein [Mycobacteroides abscessus subsp. abscessus]|nr:Uncharacterised protein [Mycobacteroides abscessus subsp. abscessus]
MSNQVGTLSCTSNIPKMIATMPAITPPMRPTFRPTFHTPFVDHATRTGVRPHGDTPRAG